MFVRRNESAAGLAQHPEFRFRVGVAVPLTAANEHGLPGKEEMEQLDIIEDLLSTRLEADQQSLQVLAITTNGMRELVFYTRNPNLVQAAIDALRAEVTSHELQSYVQEDPKWTVFRQFA